MTPALLHTEGEHDGQEASSLETTEVVRVEVVLTKRQKRAMHAFLWAGGREGFDTQAYDSSIWDVGVRPWPTAANLQAKGLIESVRWWGSDEGYEYRLTALGCEYMRDLVAERLGSATRDCEAVTTKEGDVG